MYPIDDNTPTTPSGLAFTGNPIIVSDDLNSSGQPVTGYPFEIECNGATIFTGRFNYPYSINLAKIIDAFCPRLPEPDDYNESSPGDPIHEIVDYDNMDNGRRFTVTFHGITTRVIEFYAIPGGISRQNFRQIARQAGEDIFTKRFLADNANFFMTTRTSGWRIYMKETELYPLYFISDIVNSTIKIIEKATDEVLLFNNIGQGIFALDIDAVRYRFFTDFGVLSNNFEIYRGDSYACRVVIEQAETVKERYRLKFRNSLGVFEIIELTGDITVTPEWDGSDDNVYSAYDPVNDDYISARDRVVRKQKITIKTGVKRPDETAFIMDMLGSDEVYLLDMTDLPVKVIPSAENFDYRSRPEAPQIFTILLVPVENETYIMPDIVDGSEFSRQRVHSKEFSKEFN